MRCLRPHLLDDVKEAPSMLALTMCSLICYLGRRRDMVNLRLAKAQIHLVAR